MATTNRIYDTFRAMLMGSIPQGEETPETAEQMMRSVTSTVNDVGYPAVHPWAGPAIVQGGGELPMPATPSLPLVREVAFTAPAWGPLESSARVYRGYDNSEAHIRRMPWDVATRNPVNVNIATPPASVEEPMTPEQEQRAAALNRRRRLRGAVTEDAPTRDPSEPPGTPVAVLPPGRASSRLSTEGARRGLTEFAKRMLLTTGAGTVDSEETPFVMINDQLWLEADSVRIEADRRGEVSVVYMWRGHHVFTQPCTGVLFRELTGTLTLDGIRARARIEIV